MVSIELSFVMGINFVRTRTGTDCICIVTQIYTLEKRFNFKMLNSICNGAGSANLLESFLICSAMNLTDVSNDDEISLISKTLVKYKSDFSQLVIQNIRKAQDVFLAICEIGSVYLLEYMADFHNDALNQVKCTVTDNDQNGLHLAVWNQNLSAVEFLLERVYFPNGTLVNDTGMSILNGATNNKETPIVYACKRKSQHSLAIFKSLLKYKCDIAPLNDHSSFPMFVASVYNHITNNMH